jgi:hypothetical protein
MATTDLVGTPITTELGNSPLMFTNITNVAPGVFGTSRTYAGVSEDEVSDEVVAPEAEEEAPEADTAAPEDEAPAADEEAADDTEVE